eukprot:150283-Rhodomonas_salina.1
MRYQRRCSCGAPGALSRPRLVPSRLPRDTARCCTRSPAPFRTRPARQHTTAGPRARTARACNQPDTARPPSARCSTPAFCTLRSCIAPASPAPPHAPPQPSWCFRASHSRVPPHNRGAAPAQQPPALACAHGCADAVQQHRAPGHHRFYLKVLQKDLAARCPAYNTAMVCPVISRQLHTALSDDLNGAPLDRRRPSHRVASREDDDGARARPRGGE